MGTVGILIIVGVFVLVLALFAGLVWLFVLLSRGRMHPRQEVQTPVKQTPPAKGSSEKGPPVKGPPVKAKRPRR